MAEGGDLAILVEIASAYQERRKRRRAQARELLGPIPRPQQKHLLTAMRMTWLRRRKRRAPTPNPVAMSES